ncbi:hypothetical protein [Cohnella kolymensis]|uniref:hypothetical protein n=1 Tax=Cohnella kolymensis TaxID=1590652 RepID=UPI000695CE22|nr:hypothetical protein [Cohnella kolymensis]
MMKKFVYLILLIAVCISGCTSRSEPNAASADSVNLRGVADIQDPKVKHCPDAEIDYIDALMWNDIQYRHIGETDSIFTSQDVSKLVKGKELGEIGYTLADNACMGYKMKSGDATFLPKGTKVYEVVGYKSTFRLLAGEKLYQSDGNPKAHTVSDVYDIEGRVSKISFESTYDGHHLSYFTEEAVSEFIEEYLALEYVGFDEIYKKGKGLGDTGRQFLRIHLDDGTSFRISYWTEENLISPGAAGTDKLKTITILYMIGPFIGIH